MTISALIRKIKSLHKANIGADQYIVKRLETQRDKFLSYIYELDAKEFYTLGNTRNHIIGNIKYTFLLPSKALSIKYCCSFDNVISFFTINLLLNIYLYPYLSTPIDEHIIPQNR